MLFRFLTRTSVLWWAGLAYLGLTLAFVAVMWIWDFQVIDEIFLEELILSSVAELDQTQKQVHILVTATLDVAYPFAYGIFQAGMAYRFLGQAGKWLAPLSLLCVPVDLLEGFSQVMILSGQLEYVGLKTVVTPIKLILYVPGLCGALVALGIVIVRRRRES